MRKLNQFLLLVMTMSIMTLTSCSSDDDSAAVPGGGTGDEFLTAKIDGSNFAASQSPSVIVGAQSTGGVLAVQGGDNNGNTINMSIANYTGVGTYTTGDSLMNSNGIQYLQVSPLATWASNLATAAVGTLQAGTVEITSDDGTTVEGTFIFEGYNADDMSSKMVTEGSFKAKFD